MFVAVPLLRSYSIGIRLYARRKHFFSFSVNSLGEFLVVPKKVWEGKIPLMNLLKTTKNAFSCHKTDWDVVWIHEWYGDKHMVVRNKKNSYDLFSNCLEKFLETSEVTTWVTRKSIFWSHFTPKTVKNPKSPNEFVKNHKNCFLLS